MLGESVFADVGEGGGARGQGELVAAKGAGAGRAGPSGGRTGRAARSARAIAVARLARLAQVFVVDHRGQRKAAADRLGEDQNVGRDSAVLERPVGAGPADTRPGLVDDERDGLFGRAGAQVPYQGVRRRKHPGLAPDRLQEQSRWRLLPRLAVAGERPVGERLVGDGDHTGASGGGADQRDGGGDGIGSGGAEPHARVAGEFGRKGAQQLGDEGVLDRGGEVHDMQGGAGIEHRADRLQDDGVVVAQGQGPPAGHAVQVTAAVGALDGQPPRADRYDRESTRVGARGRFAHRLAPRSALVRTGLPRHRLPRGALSRA